MFCMSWWVSSIKSNDKIIKGYNIIKGISNKTKRNKVKYLWKIVYLEDQQCMNE